MTFQIALVQFNPVRKNPSANINRLQSLLSGLKADLIVLPELSNSGYLYKTPENLKPFSEPKDGSGPFLLAMRDLAVETGSLIIAGYSELDKDQIFNASAAVSPDGVVENYRKVHLYADEKLLFHPGDSGFIVFDWQGVKIGMMICFDWIFPEAARTLAIAGAQIIAHPANLVLPFCQDAMITRALENKVFTITANRIGKERSGNNTLKFTGASQMTRPNGEILYRGPKNKATVHIISIDPEEALDKAINDLNNLFEDRRSTMYKI